MIFDKLDTMLCDYGNMDARLARAFEWAKSTDLAALPDGTHPIDGKRIFVIVASYKTQPVAERRFETHRSYCDIQLVVKGKELIYWAPSSSLTEIETPYSAERDVAFFNPPAEQTPLVLHPGYFAVFFPSDGHRPNCCVDQPEDVKKATCKIAL